MKCPSRRTFLLIAAVSATTILVTSLTAIWLSRITNLRIPSLGTIKTLGAEAYWDKNLTNQTKEIKWSTIWPGSSQNISLFIRSTSNAETTLILNATNWNPTNLSDYLNLVWDYNGTTVRPEETIEVTLTLSASSSYEFITYLITNDVRQFSFDITISTSEYT